jgi:hypothetical protein
VSIRVDYLDPNKSRPQTHWALNKRLAILYGYTHRNTIKVTRCRDDVTLRDCTAEILEGIEAHEATEHKKAAQRQVEQAQLEQTEGYGTW